MESFPPASPATTPRNNGKALASVIMGAISPLLGGVILGTLAIIFGVLAKREIRERGETGDGMATAGIALGIVGIVVAFAMVVWLVSRGPI